MEASKGRFFEAELWWCFSYFQTTARMAIIIRDSKGQMIIVRIGKRALCTLLLIGIKAVLLGIKPVSALGIRKLIIEGDSKEVINSLKGTLEEYPLEIRLCNDDCKNSLSSFEFLEIKHVEIEGNKVAHALARHGITCPSLIDWTGNIP